MKLLCSFKFFSGPILFLPKSLRILAYQTTAHQNSEIQIHPAQIMRKRVGQKKVTEPTGQLTDFHQDLQEPPVRSVAASHGGAHTTTGTAGRLVAKFPATVRERQRTNSDLIHRFHCFSRYLSLESRFLIYPLKLALKWHLLLYMSLISLY